MTVLRPHMPLDPEETSLSFANRLALMHTGRGLRYLLRDLDINVPGYVSGHTYETTMLAERSGIAPEALLANTIDVKQSHVKFRHQRLSRAFLSPRAARFCPGCLVDDGPRTSWRHRIAWGVRHVHRCVHHGLWLVSADLPSAEVLPEAISAIGPTAPCAAEGSAPDYLGWLHSNLIDDRGAVPSWLDGQTPEQVLNASEMIGAVLEHGHCVRIKQLAPAEAEQATDIGFNIYIEGPEAVAEALDTIHARSSASAVQAGPLAYYGALYDWLDRRTNAIDPGPIRTILRDHLLDRFAIDPGTTVLGQEVATRSVYTLQTLSDHLGIHRRRLSRILQKLGKVPTGAPDKESGKIVFKAVEILPLIDEFQTAISFHDLPAYLGATKRQVDGLYRAGQLLPLVPAAARGAVRQVVFARRHLDQVLSGIAGLDELVGSDVGWRPVAYVCQRGAGPFPELFSVTSVKLV